MLVLSRKQGESIQIDENIFVTVSEVKGGRVRLSIDAPRSVRIVRKEVLDRDFGKDLPAKEHPPQPQPPLERAAIVLDLPAMTIADCLN